MSKGEETRQFIIETSASLFNTKGIAATAMSDIMEATKLSKGSLYVHFENKEDLANEVVDYSLDTLKTKVNFAMAKAKTGKDKLFTYIDMIADVQNPPLIGGCPMINFGTEADDTNPKVKYRVAAAMRNAQKMISDIIHIGKENGEFDPNWNAEEFATVMFAMLEGGVVMGRAAGNNMETSVIAKHLKNIIDQHTLSVQK